MFQTSTESVSIPESVSALESEPLSTTVPVRTPTPVRIYDSVRFPLVFSRNPIVPDLTQVRNDIPSLANDDTVSSDSHLHV